MIWKYPPEFDAFIRENAPGRHDWEIAELARQAGWDVNEQQVKCYRNNHKIKTGISPNCEKRKYYIKYSPEIEQFIRDNVNGVQSSELTRMVNEAFGTSYKVSQIQGFKKNRKIVSNVDTKFVEGSPNVRSQFKKGDHISPATEFKKGHIPDNYCEVGSIRVRKGVGRSSAQTYIKLTDTHNPRKDWQLYNRYVWEQANGPIPKGKCIVYLDGNPENCSLDNLMCVSRAAITYINKRHLKQGDPELMRTQYITAMLNNEIYRREKEE